MQNRLMISIVDDNGSTQFSVHYIVKKILLFMLCAISFSVVSYFVVMYFLIADLKVVLADNAKMRENFQIIYEKNSELERDIDYKTNELLRVSSKVNELESIVNIGHNHKNYSNEDVEFADIGSLQKEMILKIIPNGNPVDNFILRTFPSNSNSVFSLARGTPVYATANGIIDSVRTTGSENHFIQIQHSYGFASNYGHLAKVNVQKGDYVAKGQIIGYSGVSLHYNLHFIDNVLPVVRYVDWSSDNFNKVIEANSAIDWKSLVLALDDIVKLKSYRIGLGEEYPSVYIHR